jgi:hypothetical protein
LYRELVARGESRLAFRNVRFTDFYLNALNFATAMQAIRDELSIVMNRAAFTQNKTAICRLDRHSKSV